MGAFLNSGPVSWPVPHLCLKLWVPPYGPSPWGVSSSVPLGPSAQSPTLSILGPLFGSLVLWVPTLRLSPPRQVSVLSVTRPPPPQSRTAILATRIRFASCQPPGGSTLLGAGPGCPPPPGWLKGPPSEPAHASRGRWPGPPHCPPPGAAPAPSASWVGLGRLQNPPPL